MLKNDIKLLDCSLRDGGYVNDWKWGFLRAKDIIRSLIQARVDVIEVGFLKNVDGYNENITTCNKIEELNRLLPDETENAMFSAMAMCSNYDVTKLSPYIGKGIELIRITAHDYDIDEGLEFAEKVQALGYKVSINPINIMGYSNSQILQIIEKTNKIHPYQFSIVDTFGSMKRIHLDRIANLVNSELLPDIRLGLHLHENLASSIALSQHYLLMNLQRPIAIDASLLGIGRIPGNLPIELIADFMNDECGKNYKIEHMLDAIESHISQMHGSSEWGYNAVYFLSARYNLHRNYSEYYVEKGDLTHRDIDKIFQGFNLQKKTAFDAQYADEIYLKYKQQQIDDTIDRERLTSELSSRNILILAPGDTLNTHKEVISDYITAANAIVIAINFVPYDYKTDYAFYGNARRYQMLKNSDVKNIITSNIQEEADYKLNYNVLVSAKDKHVNSLPLLLRFLKSIRKTEVAIAGADGFTQKLKNYFDDYLWSMLERDKDVNDYTSKILYGIGLELDFITPSVYKRGE
jgi:4-hydroxy 2-oxovalerate aldolase